MRYAGAFILFVLFFSASFTMFTVEASWTKVAGFKFISGTSLGSETTYYGELDDARPPCQQRCDNLKPCKAIRLYSFVVVDEEQLKRTYKPWLTLYRFASKIKNAQKLSLPV
ncbi:hypothetical protein ACROYT_G039029 [Oculina patagonica]